MISFLFQLAALDLNSADVQGVTGSEYLFNSDVLFNSAVQAQEADFALDEVMLSVKKWSCMFAMLTKSVLHQDVTFHLI